MNPPEESEAISPEGRALRIVGRYPRRSDAYERALVVLAMEIPHWLIRADDGFQLCVDPAQAGAVEQELEKFERERASAPRESAAVEKHPLGSLLVAGWIMALFFMAQNLAPAWWEDAGESSSEAVLRGAWWRVFTALTLHADFSHIGANLAAGLVFAAFLLPLLGTGWTWLGIVLTGGLGNALNAWGHRGEAHHSIGASTAVFGALGLLAGAQVAARLLALRRVSAREVLVPIGAGLALLAFLGVGDEHTDFTAHFFGLLAGLPLGAAALAVDLKRRTPAAWQIVLGVAAPALLGLAWWLAATHA